jgi:hypothetical protein
MHEIDFGKHLIPVMQYGKIAPHVPIGTHDVEVRFATMFAATVTSSVGVPTLCPRLAF